MKYKIATMYQIGFKALITYMEMDAPTKVISIYGRDQLCKIAKIRSQLNV